MEKAPPRPALFIAQDAMITRGELPAESSSPLTAKLRYSKYLENTSVATNIKSKIIDITGQEIYSCG